MKYKEFLMRQQEMMLKMEIGYLEWLRDHFREPSEEEPDETEEYLYSQFFNNNVVVKPLNNQTYNPKQAAKENSTCPSGARGGELGTFGQGQMVPEFDKVVFNDEVGVVHGPVQTQFGYHLLEVTERS